MWTIALTCRRRLSHWCRFPRRQYLRRQFKAIFCADPETAPPTYLQMRVDIGLRQLALDVFLKRSQFDQLPDRRLDEEEMRAYARTLRQSQDAFSQAQEIAREAHFQVWAHLEDYSPKYEVNSA